VDEVGETVVKKYYLFGGSPLFLLFLVFLVLKLTKVIDWSWFWVLSPILFPFIIGIVILLIVVFVVIIGALLKRRRRY